MTCVPDVAGVGGQQKPRKPQWVVYKVVQGNVKAKDASLAMCVRFLCVWYTQSRNDSSER